MPNNLANSHTLIRSLNRPGSKLPGASAFSFRSLSTKSRTALIFAIVVVMFLLEPVAFRFRELNIESQFENVFRPLLTDKLRRCTETIYIVFNGLLANNPMHCFDRQRLSFVAPPAVRHVGFEPC